MSTKKITVKLSHDEMILLATALDVYQYTLERDIHSFADSNENGTFDSAISSRYAAISKITSLVGYLQEVY